jgi:hypothetical protein
MKFMNMIKNISLAKQHNMNAKRNANTYHATWGHEK